MRKAFQISCFVSATQTHFWQCVSQALVRLAVSTRSHPRSKAGVIGLTKAIAKEIAVDGVRVNAIAPTMIEIGL